MSEEIFSQNLTVSLNSSALGISLELHSQQEDMETEVSYEPNRRSSFGAESLLEHDISEETGQFDCEGLESQLLVEAQLGLEYADDIFSLNLRREEEYHPFECVKNQPEVTEHMRCTIIHWLTKVNRQLKFSSETIFVATSFIDRFLASTPIAHDCLQLLAICSLFVAAKMEESTLPSISSLVTLCGTNYRHHHFRRMEALLLNMLEFNLLSPTSWFFVTHLLLKACQLAPLDRRMLSLARYAIETCLASYAIGQFLPSIQAASALCYSSLSLYSSWQLGGETNEEGSTFSLLFSLPTSASSSLFWVIHTTFSYEDIMKIESCVEQIRIYMRPFLESSSTLDTNSPFFTNEVLPSLRLASSSACEPKTAESTVDYYDFEHSNKADTLSLGIEATTYMGEAGRCCCDDMISKSINQRFQTAIDHYKPFARTSSDEKQEELNCKNCNIGSVFKEDESDKVFDVASTPTAFQQLFTSKKERKKDDEALSVKKW